MVLRCQSKRSKIKLCPALWTNAFPADIDVPVEVIASNSSLISGEQQVSLICFRQKSARFP